MEENKVFKISYKRADRLMRRVLEEVRLDTATPNALDELMFEYDGGSYAVYLTIDAYGKRTLDIWDYRVSGDKHREITVDPWNGTASYVRWLY